LSWSRRITLAVASGLVVACAAAVGAHAAELKVLSGNGARAAVTELVAQFERASGHKVALAFEVNPGVRRRIEAGEAFDVAVLNPPVLDALIRQGKVVAASRTVLGRAGIGLAVKAGAPTPDLGSVDGFKRTLLGAKSVAYPGEGASGRYFADLVERLGIGAEMRSRMRPMPAEYNVEGVASGEFEFVVVVASRIAGVPGVDLAGLIPRELQTWIGFTAGIAEATREREAAAALLRFFTSPSAAEILKARGVDPFVE
jgi:molybdate transport system substrate-binding protein